VNAEHAREQPNGERGLAGEQAVAARLDELRLVPDDQGPEWYDGVLVEDTFVDGRRVAEGTPVEAKVAARRVDASGSTRRGRYWFRRSSHRRLVDEWGVYAFVVARDASAEHVAPLAVEVVPAADVDDILAGRSWWRVRGYEATQVPWGALLDPSDVPGEGGESG
jgi:hypothetical protein